MSFEHNPGVLFAPGDAELAAATVNYHFIKPCDMHCDFCFATYEDVANASLVGGTLGLSDMRALILELGDAGFRKINFAGGEPFIYPQVHELFYTAKRNWMVTSVVTNGAALFKQGEAEIHHLGKWLDIATLSIDSINESVLNDTGRTTKQGPMTMERYAALARWIKAAGIQLKINTVVTSANQQELLAPFIAELEPVRWKIFEAKPIEGQNTGRIDRLRVSPASFADYVLRQTVAIDGEFPVVAESADDMSDSYIMVDPLGRFIGSAASQQEDGSFLPYICSEPILTVGAYRAFHQAYPHLEALNRRFVDRGGSYTLDGVYRPPKDVVARYPELAHYPNVPALLPR